jgi:hypothetical protein
MDDERLARVASAPPVTAGEQDDPAKNPQHPPVVTPPNRPEAATARGQLDISPIGPAWRLVSAIRQVQDALLEMGMLPASELVLQNSYQARVLSAALAQHVDPTDIRHRHTHAEGYSPCTTLMGLTIRSDR